MNTSLGLAQGSQITPYLQSFTPIFGLGTPVFQRISSNLHSGTQTFSKVCLWDSYFQNPSENPVAAVSFSFLCLFTVGVKTYKKVFASSEQTLFWSNTLSRGANRKLQKRGFSN